MSTATVLSALFALAVRPASAPVPAPPAVVVGPSPLAAADAVDAAEIAAPSPEFEPLGLLALAVRSAEARDRTALQAIETAEAKGRPGGRTAGLEWAYEELFTGTDRLRQVGDLLAILARHPAAVRAIVETDRGRWAS